jgi:hypothetical protein
VREKKKKQKKRKKKRERRKMKPNVSTTNKPRMMQGKSQ